jgi:aquaporin Z
MLKSAKYVTEFVGTFIFLSVIALSGPIGALAPLAIGSVLMVMVYMGGHISGAHYNPAVSLGLFLREKIGLDDLIAYWGVQLLAGVAAFSFGWGLSGHTSGIKPGPGVTNFQALSAEVVFTTALLLVILNVAATKETEGNSFYGLAIGFTVAVGAFAVGPISGGAFNPAVGFGATFAAAAFAGGSWAHLWLYILGPALGAAIAAAIHVLQIAGLEQGEAPAAEELSVPALGGVSPTT